MIGDHKSRELQRGFTLVETIAAMGIFLVLMTILLGVFMNALSLERRALATQAALENARYTFEIMARAIRQANPQPPAPIDTVFFCSSEPGTCLVFIHQNAAKGTMLYRFNSVTKKIEEWSTSTGNVWVPITNSDVVVEQLNFYVSGNGPGNNGQSDLQQPRVTIYARVSSVKNPSVVATIQTTVSVRSLQE